MRIKHKFYPHKKLQTIRKGWGPSGKEQEFITRLMS